jgi:hypothetical protein
MSGAREDECGGDGGTAPAPLHDESFHDCHCRKFQHDKGRSTYWYWMLLGRNNFGARDHLIAEPSTSSRRRSAAGSRFDRESEGAHRGLALRANR